MSSHIVLVEWPDHAVGSTRSYYDTVEDAMEAAATIAELNAAVTIEIQHGDRRVAWWSNGRWEVYSGQAQDILQELTGARHDSVAEALRLILKVDRSAPYSINEQRPDGQRPASGTRWPTPAMVVRELINEEEG